MRRMCGQSPAYGYGGPQPITSTPGGKTTIAISKSSAWRGPVDSPPCPSGGDSISPRSKTSAIVRHDMILPNIWRFGLREVKERAMAAKYNSRRELENAWRERLHRAAALHQAALANLSNVVAERLKYPHTPFGPDGTLEMQ